LGGGWRQAGILAAAAIMALENGVQTVTRDHANARRLANGSVSYFVFVMWDV
jgi:threonine aldolase